jgi:hypothetical protein
LTGRPQRDSANATKIFTGFNGPPSTTENTITKFRKYKQTFELSEAFHFPFGGKSVTAETASYLLEAELKLTVNLSRLITPIPPYHTAKTGFDPRDKRFSQLVLEFRFHLAGQELSSDFKNSSLNKFKLRLDYSFDDFQSKLNSSKVVRFKLSVETVRRLTELVADISNNLLSRSNEFRFDLSLKITFKSGLKRFKLNSRLTELAELFVKSPVLTLFIKQDSNIGAQSESFDLTEQIGCGRRGVAVSVEELGWSGVILEPKWINLTYCEPGCAIAGSETFKMVTKPVCAPSIVSSVFFLMFEDDGTLVLKRVDGLVAVSAVA